MNLHKINTRQMKSDLFHADECQAVAKKEWENSITDSNKWGDGKLYEKMNKISTKKQKLIDIIKSIDSYNKSQY